MEKLNLNDLKVAIDDFKTASELMTSVSDALEASSIGFFSSAPSELNLIWEKDLADIAKICHKTIRIKSRNEMMPFAYFTYRGVTFVCRAISETGKEILLEAGAIEEEPKGENA